MQGDRRMEGSTPDAHISLAAHPPHGGMLVDEREQALLAPYAMFSRNSAGRKIAEQEHPYRGPFQRDRDRILHSAAFRRLSGKMQVFTGEMGDYHRTRLTHTQEVASIARTIGRVLRLNEDLIEALALVHDIGHPPFGHAGEDALDECLREDGGFSHNRFALTIVEDMEIRYVNFRGLNLTREVLEGQADRADKAAVVRQPLLEVQLVDVADSTTYDAHDTDDAVKLGLVTLEEMRSIPLIDACVADVLAEYTALPPGLLIRMVVKRLIDRQVTDIVQTTAVGLAERRFQSSEEARSSDFRIGPSPELAAQKEELERFLYNRVYRHPQLIEVRQQAQQKLHEMFAGYIARPELFPPKYQERAERVGVRRMAGDYLAGMTDRFCEETYETHFR